MSGGLTRRRLLHLGAVTGAALVGLAGCGRVTPVPAAPIPATSPVHRPAAHPRGPVFLHGVASGDPLPGGVLLWTRVTPVPEAVPGSGLGASVPVTWEVAADPEFRRVVGRDTTWTGPERDHTVKVDVGDLEPASDYWYRFTCGRVSSPVGRTRTAPAAGARVDRLRLGVVSCANLQAGYFSAYRHLAARGDLDLVLHLGDYLYEYGPGESQARDVVVRPHDPPHECRTLADYRARHAQYKGDPDLQALHAAVPWVVTWDDHEVANDAWAGGAENHTEGAEGSWADRRAAAQQAYAEWMPVRYEAGGVLYRRFRYGRLAGLTMLDLRSYRSRQPASPDDPALADGARTMTGSEQMAFLLDGLADPTVQWKLVGNSVFLSPLRLPTTLQAAAAEGIAGMIGDPAPPMSGAPLTLDDWDGYPAQRETVIGHLRDAHIRNAVFLTGDIHSGWACELPAEPATYAGTPVSAGTEFVCTSVNADNLDDALRAPPRTASLAVETRLKANNPHVRYVDFDSNGYSVFEVTPEAAQMDWYVLIDRADPNSGAVWSASFRVLSGTARVQPAPQRLSDGHVGRRVSAG